MRGSHNSNGSGGNFIQIQGIQPSVSTLRAAAARLTAALEARALIGEGTFGKVYKGMNERTGELLAVKQLSIMDGSEEDVRGLQKEISVMWHLTTTTSSGLGTASRPSGTSSSCWNTCPAGLSPTCCSSSGLSRRS